MTLIIQGPKSGLNKPPYNDLDYKVSLDNRCAARYDKLTSLLNHTFLADLLY